MTSALVRLIPILTLTTSAGRSRIVRATKGSSIALPLNPRLTRSTPPRAAARAAHVVVGLAAFEPWLIELPWCSQTRRAPGATGATGASVRSATSSVISWCGSQSSTSLSRAGRSVKATVPTGPSRVSVAPVAKSVSSSGPAARGLPVDELAVDDEVVAAVGAWRDPDERRASCGGRRPRAGWPRCGTRAAHPRAATGRAASWRSARARAHAGRRCGRTPSSVRSRSSAPRSSSGTISVVRVARPTLRRSRGHRVADPARAASRMPHDAASDDGPAGVAWTSPTPSPIARRRRSAARSGTSSPTSRAPASGARSARAASGTRATARGSAPTSPATTSSPTASGRPPARWWPPSRAGSSRWTVNGGRVYWGFETAPDGEGTRLTETWEFPPVGPRLLPGALRRPGRRGDRDPGRRRARRDPGDARGDQARHRGVSGTRRQGNGRDGPAARGGPGSGTSPGLLGGKSPDVA